MPWEGLAKRSASGYQQGMKPITGRLALFAGLLTFQCVSLRAQENVNETTNHISALEAKQHLNSYAVVRGKVVEVSKAEKVVRLNFEKPFPYQPFTAIIFSNRTNLFGDLGRLKDQIIEVRGRITEYRGRPEIILLRTNQLQVLEKAISTQRKEP